MTEYTESSMVKKEHVKFIANKLTNLKSKIPEGIDKNEEHALANLLYLAYGGGKYGLEKDKIITISDGTFSIAKSAIDFLCAKSPTRKS